MVALDGHRDRCRKGGSMDTFQTLHIIRNVGRMQMAAGEEGVCSAYGEP